MLPRGQNREMLLAVTLLATQILILTGGKTEAEAEKRLENLSTLVSEMGDVVAFPPDFPAVVKSDQYEGLKPGFFIVVAGVCDDKALKPALETLKVLVPGTYAKPITWKKPGDPPCPSLGEEPPGRGWNLEKTVTQGKVRVHAFQYQYTHDGGEYEDKRWAAIAVLEGREKDSIDDVEVVQSEGAFATFESLSTKGNAIALSEDHSDATCIGRSGPIGVASDTITVTAKATALAIVRTSQPQPDHICPEEESYGDAPPDPPPPDEEPIGD